MAAQLEYQSGHTILREKNNLESDTLDKTSLISTQVVNTSALSAPLIKNTFETNNTNSGARSELGDVASPTLPVSKSAPRDLPQVIASNIRDTYQPGNITEEMQNNFINMRKANFEGEYFLPKIQEPLKETLLKDSDSSRANQTLHFDYVRLDDHSDVSGNLR